MPDTHYTEWMAAWLDEALDTGQKVAVEEHLAVCAACRAECELVRTGMAMLSELPSVKAPDSLWASIEKAPRSRRPVMRWALAAMLILTAGAAGLWLRQPRLPYVTLRAGAAVQQHSAAHWISTDAASRARVNIPIGVVELGPNTSIRVLSAKADEHRLSLRNGTLRASIQAPPRLFFVETSAGTAIDLGCEYTIECDRRGFGVLRVTRGWVSYESRGKTSLVPAGAMCWTREGHGPGTPVFADSATPLIDALQSFDFARGGDAALGVILSAARVRDTLTLWHLLARSTIAQRETIYERMAALSPPPSNVLREDVLRLDAPALERWKAELAWQW
ncbi:MAG: zf-HC2 domain-containing protein [Acidobacteria bacterium]|nr:zf-HC2 domain-containing protein [Acidobacteriota bacterium]